VLLLNPISGDGWGGVEKWMRLLAGRLVRDGHAVAACAKPDSRWAASCREQGLPTAEVAMRGDFHPRDLLAVRAVFRDRGIDLVVVKMHQCIRMAWAAGLLRGRQRPAILCRMGNSMMKRSLGARLTYRYLADRYVTPSEVARRELLAYGYYGPERVRAIPNGVEIPPDDPAARARIRAELGLGAAPVLVSTSRFHPIKGVRHLLDAFALLRAAFPSVRLVLAGDGAERQNLTEQARQLGVADAVVFTGFRADVADLLRAADLFALPSLREGLPNGALEAMAAGLPVVATAADGVPDAVVDGETGLLVPPGQAAPLRDAVARLLTEPNLAARMGHAGRERVREHFSLERTLADSEAYCIETRDARRGVIAGKKSWGETS